MQLVLDVNVVKFVNLYRNGCLQGLFQHGLFAKSASFAYKSSLNRTRTIFCDQFFAEAGEIDVVAIRVDVQVLDAWAKMVRQLAERS